MTADRADKMNDFEMNANRDLGARVRRYRVLWSLVPKHLPETLNGQRVGFDLELWGSHDHPSAGELDECDECLNVVALLEEVAARITPASCEFRTSGSEPVDFRTSSHPRSGFGRRVRLGLEVVCRGGYHAVRSECDGRCFFMMGERLLELGARRM